MSDDDDAKNNSTRNRLFAHFGVQNSVVHEFLKYLRIIVEKYITKYQLFSIFSIMLFFINIYLYANI